MPRPGFCCDALLRSWGKSLSVRPMLVAPCGKNDSPLIAVSGTVDSRLGRRMREPVTTIEASVSAGCAASAARWAAAGRGAGGWASAKGGAAENGAGKGGGGGGGKSPGGGGGVLFFPLFLSGG